MVNKVAIGAGVGVALAIILTIVLVTTLHPDINPARRPPVVTESQSNDPNSPP